MNRKQEHKTLSSFLTSLNWIFIKRVIEYSVRVIEYPTEYSGFPKPYFSTFCKSMNGSNTG